MKKPICFFLAVTMLMTSLSITGCRKITDPEATTGVTPENPSVDTLVYDLRTDDMVNPVGTDTANPEFSWKMNSTVIGQKQTAYQIIVKNEAGTVVWDSGKTESGDSVDIPYAGQPLTASTEYTWDLTVWDKDDKTVTQSATFETGLFGTSGFSDAKWISYNEGGFSDEKVYTIDFDFILDSSNMGFCFHVTDSNNMFMWQFNTNQLNNGRVLLRPHIKAGGNWTALADIDITDKIGMTASEVIGKKLHERLEVDNKTVKTYIGTTADDLVLVYTYTATTTLTLEKIGFRHFGGEQEYGRYDNIVIKDKDGNTLYENDFSGDDTGFDANGGTLTLKDGMISVVPSGGTEMICIQRDGSAGLPAFRKSFTPAKNLVSAKLYTTALGVYESYINGQRVGRMYPDGTVEYHELKPGSAEMADRKYYSSYDVTWMIQAGSENVLSAVVTSGWWSGLIAANYGKEDAYMAKLILRYDDGSEEIITTDTTWKAARASAVTLGNIYNGESYDARIDQSWMFPGFDDSSWEKVKINREFKGQITSWMGSYITVHEELERTAQSITVYKGATGATGSAYGKINVIKTYDTPSFTLNPGEVALIDFGQNCSGWEAFTVEGESSTVITVEHGEILNDRNGEISRGNDGPGGSIYNANYRSALATTHYTLNGNGQESYHPSFTYYGFRYIEITTTKPVTFSSITGQVVSSVEKDIGFIETSNDNINQLISNIRWGQYSNYLSVPTDCPQRDERLGWTADTQVFAEAGSYLGFSKSFLEKFMQDMRDAQASDGSFPGVAPTGQYNGCDWGGTGWADAGVIVPYTLYVMYDDISVITDNWTAMQKYVDGYLGKTNKKGPRNIWGDWLAYESNDAEIQSILAVAYYAWDARMMAEMAAAAGYTDQVQKYLDLYETEKAYFIEQYVNDSGRLKRNEQSVCLYALYLDLLPDKDSVNAVIKQLTTNIARNGNRLQTGFLGTKIILDTLTKIGRSDLAYTLLLQENNPSWLYSVLQGATTIWERWNSYTLDTGFGDVGMNSFNHYAYGAVAGWMFHTMAGINYDTNDPGFKHIILAPYPDSRIGTVKASYDSAYGLITVDSQYDGSVWNYSASIPANTSAEVRIPVSSFSSITVNGKNVDELTAQTDGIVYKGTENGVAYFDAVAGSFTFVCQ
ncbi:MAG: family 78 glycoside hydrolase catalytic domain [Eubacteriales bacterium]